MTFYDYAVKYITAAHNIMDFQDESADFRNRLDKAEKEHDRQQIAIITVRIQAALRRVREQEAVMKAAKGSMRRLLK
jgi:hypothetical protein